MLYFVATPIGNLKDISYRAIETLKQCDLILCEDTRTSKTFLDAYDIKKPLESFHKFNYKEMTPKVVQMLKQGKQICLISDAGTPCISDPGAELIDELNKNNLKYSIIPGACAFLNAFCLSGFSAPFTFVGFLPDNNKERKILLNKLVDNPFTMAFYSAPHDLAQNIKILADCFGDRKACTVRELTKLHEEVEYFNLASGYPKQPRGEYVLIVDGAGKNICELNNLSVLEHYDYYVKLGISNNDAIKKVASDMGVAKSIIYNQIVALKQTSKTK